MYTPVQLALRYIRYYCTASNGKGHGVHSPFVFELITRVLNDDRDFYMYQPIENLREELLTWTTEITIEDFGAGSRVKKSPVRKISAIAASSLKPRKFGQLLFRLVNYFSPATILELGTSLGITTAYLASANSNAHVITMEGSAAVAEIARSNFNKLGLKNIKLVTGNFDETLGPLLAGLHQIDVAFLDGNHRYEPTMRYFNQVMEKAHANTLIILDDIHWSREMEQAWEEVKGDSRIRLTIDLFYIGLVFLRSEQQEKEDFIIRF
ncbi:MAG: class I SAM-dependent methyltransferase [Sphingobacteriia bacterium]|nr:class I SAM-dependent methyltransferase [Sphingobacteriia bacterium]